MIALFLINFVIYIAFNYLVPLDLSWKIIFYGGLACCIAMTIIEYQIIRLYKKHRAKKNSGKYHLFQIQSADVQDNSIKHSLLQSIGNCQNTDAQINTELQILRREKSRKIQSQKKKARIASIEKRIEDLQKQKDLQLWDAEAGLTELEKEKYALLCQKFRKLETSQKMFYLNNANDAKELSLDFAAFKFINFTNPVPCFQYGNNKLYIYPKFFLKIENQVILKITEFGTNGEITYYEHKIEEKSLTTSDSTTLSTYYLHTNKDGSPDLRYAYNPQIKIKGYGLIRIALQNDMNNFLFSNFTAVKNFVQAWKVLTSPTATVAEYIEETSVSAKIVKSDPLFVDAARWVVQSQQGSTSMLQRKLEIGSNRTKRIMELLEAAGIVSAAIGDKPRQVLVHTEYELTSILGSLPDLPNSTNETENIPESIADNAIDDNTDSKYQDELKSLIGLDKVKNEIEHLANFIKMQQLRRKRGMKTTSVSYHCVFTGNPGTGKTTVARIVAQIYKELGVLKKGHLVETDRSGLVAEYVGQTAVKTNKIIDSAIDGVLFIDEAYSLVTNSGNDYGKEAIATLLKRMEDDRDRLIVILAGYHDEMETFIDSNPGLQSRFNRYIDFPDYTVNELMQIFCRNIEKSDYYLTDDAKEKLQKQLNEAVKNKDKNFGNARFVRNIFEKTLEHQANRLANIQNPSTDDLRNIIEQDIEI